jgi:hypothetical protein
MPTKKIDISGGKSKSSINTKEIFADEENVSLESFQHLPEDSVLQQSVSEDVDIDVDFEPSDTPVVLLSVKSIPDQFERKKGQKEEKYLIIRTQTDQNQLNLHIWFDLMRQLKGILASVQSAEIKAIIPSLDAMVSSDTSASLEGMSKRDQLLVCRDFFDDLSQRIKSSKGSEGLLKGIFRLLKAYHLTAAAPTILCHYVEDVLRKNEQFNPSFNQALPGAGSSKTETVSLRGGAGADVSAIKGTVEGVLGFSSTRAKEIGQDSFHGLTKSITVSAGVEATGTLKVPGVVGLKLVGRAKGSLVFMNYQESDTLKKFVLINFTEKNPRFAKKMTGKKAREVFAEVRKLTNLLRHLRGVPLVVRDTPYYVTPEKVAQGSGIMDGLIFLAEHFDQSVGLTSNGLAELLKKTYGLPRFKIHHVSDVSKAFGELADIAFNRKGKTHRADYTGRLISFELSGGASFDVGFGAGSGNLVDVPVFAEDADQASASNSKTTTLKAFVPSIASAAADIGMVGSWLSLPVGVSCSICEAFDPYGKTLGGARRAMTHVFEVLIDYQALEAKTHLLSPFYQGWIKELKAAVIQDRKTKPDTKKESLSAQRDRVQLKHGTAYVKKELKELSSDTRLVQHIDDALTHLEKNMEQFFDDHLKLKSWDYLQKKLDPSDAVLLQEVKQNQAKLTQEMIVRYWGVKPDSTIHQALLKDVQKDVEVFIAKTLDNFDLSLALVGMRVTAARLGKKSSSLSPQVLAQFARLKQQVTGRFWHVSKKTLNESSSIMRCARAKDIKLSFNVSFGLSGPTLGVIGAGVSKLVDEPMGASGISIGNDSDGNRIDGAGLKNVKSAATQVKTKVSFLCEYLYRASFASQLRQGHFIRLVFDLSTGGMVAFTLKKAFKHLFSHPHVVDQMGGELDSPDDQQLDDIQENLLNLLAKKGVRNTAASLTVEKSMGLSAEVLFRLSRRGCELLYVKYLRTRASEISLATPNLLAAVPLATLSIGYTDSRTKTDVASYTLHGGYLSHFTSWNRKVNTKSGDSQKDANQVLRCGVDPDYTALYTEEEFNQPNHIQAIAPQHALIKQRIQSLKKYQLLKEFFGSDGIAILMQKYLNCFVSENHSVVIPSFGNPKGRGQLSELFGSEALPVFNEATKAFTDAGFSVLSTELIKDTAPSEADRKKIATLLAHYAQQTFKEKDDRVLYFLTQTEGRQLFYFYTCVMDSSSLRGSVIEKEDRLIYVGTSDGVPADRSSEMKKLAEQTKKSIKNFKSKGNLDKAERIEESELEAEISEIEITHL